MRLCSAVCLFVCVEKIQWFCSFDGWCCYCHCCYGRCFICLFRCCFSEKNFAVSPHSFSLSLALPISLAHFLSPLPFPLPQADRHSSTKFISVSIASFSVLYYQICIIWIMRMEMDQFFPVCVRVFVYVAHTNSQTDIAHINTYSLPYPFETNNTHAIAYITYANTFVYWTDNWVLVTMLLFGGFFFVTLFEHVYECVLLCAISILI